MTATYVFAYGSLMSPTSLLRTLPAISPQSCVPVVCSGYCRTFDGAFPNDGSQADKAYLDLGGSRPPYVLMANITRADGWVHGICVPVTSDQLERLRERELRYHLEDVSESIHSDDVVPASRVVSFVGRPEHTRATDVERGVVAGVPDVVSADPECRLEPGSARGPGQPLEGGGVRAPGRSGCGREAEAEAEVLA